MDTAPIRRLASAGCLVLAPALLLAATATLPWIGDGDAEETLATVAANTTATNLGDLLLFLGPQRSRRTGSRKQGLARLLRAVKRAARHVEYLAGSAFTDLSSQFVNQFHRVNSC